MDYNEKLAALRQAMKAHDIDIFLVTTEDAYLAESADDYWRSLRWLTGFGGTLAYVLVTQDKCAFYTDSRYILIAKQVVTADGVDFYDVTQVGADHYLDWIRTELAECAKDTPVLAVDGRTITLGKGLLIKDMVSEVPGKNARFIADLDLMDEVWTDRPEPRYRKIWEHELKYAGLDRKEKLALVRDELKRRGADTFIVGTMEGVVWLSNLRGHDLKNPLFMSHALVTMERAVLFAKIERIEEPLQEKLRADGWTLLDIDCAREEISKLPEDTVLYYDQFRMNYGLFGAVPEAVKKVAGFDIVNDLKAIKNPVEIENFRKANLYEGASIFKFINHLKKHAKDGDLNEWMAFDILRNYRKECPEFIQDLDPYQPVIAYMATAAGPHYRATETSYSEIKPEGIILMDIVAHYYGGTTDITRTAYLGPCEMDEEIRHDYTVVFNALYAAMMQVIRDGADGAYIDSVPRTIIWNEHLQYGYGTGHGIGFCNAVHEGPQFIAEPSYKKEWAFCYLPLKPGVVTSMEPGIYKPGRFGIRLENDLVIVPDCVNEFGTWYKFENLTFVPFERELFDLDLLTKKQIDWINAYHMQCREKLAPFMDEEELKALVAATEPIG